MTGLFDPAVQWRAPLLLWGLAWPLLWLGMAWLRRGRGQGAVEPQLLPWMQAGVVRGAWRDHARTLLQVLAWWLLVLALAGPRLADYRYNSQALAVRDVMIVLDVSHSMSATDVEPTRLQRAVLEVQSLLAHSQYTRYGLVVYAGRPHLLAPLGSDPGVVSDYLQAIDNRLLPSAGSDLLAALRLALAELGQAAMPGTDPARAIWVLSDGELDRPLAEQQGAWDGLQTELRTRGVKVFATGVGTAAGAPLLGEQGWLSVDGEQLLSHLQAQTLKTLAMASGGTYVSAEAGDGDRRAIYDQGIAQMAMPIQDEGGAGDIHWQTLHGPYLLAGLLLWFASLWGWGRRGQALKPLRAGALLIPLALLGSSHSLQAAASALAARAHAYYQAGDYPRAQQAYTQVAGYVGRFGQGAAAYHRQDYPTAVSQFTLAFLKAGDDGQRAAALFNLGNSYFKLGDYRSAASVYADVLRYAPGFAAATGNRQLALALQAEVDKFVQEPVHGKPGRGIKEKVPPPGTSVGEAGLRLADEQDPRRSVYVPLGEEDLYQLVLRGVAFNTSGTATVPPLAESDYRGLITQELDLAQARDRIVSFHDGFVFWRSLFEYEEGFPAPVDQPVTLPGQTPW